MTQIHAICYELSTVSRFFRSVALSVAIQQHTSMEWVTYRDSSVLNATYAVLFWKESIGWEEVKTASKSAIDQTTNRLQQQFLHNWLDKLHFSGPAEAHKYVRRMEKLRDFARQAVAEMYSSSSSVNAEVFGEINNSISKLAKVRLAASIGVAVIGGAVGVAFAASAAAATGAGAAAGGISLFGLEAGASSLVFAGAGTAYSMTGPVIKNWDQGSAATVVAILPDLGKSVLSFGGDKAIEKMLDSGVSNQNAAQQAIRSADGLIRKYSNRLTQGVLRKAAERKSRNIIDRSTQNLVAQNAILSQTKNQIRLAGGLAKALPVIFAAWDILDAWSEYKETMAEISQ